MDFKQQTSQLSDLNYLAELTRRLPESPYTVIDALRIPLPWGWALIETNAPEQLESTLSSEAIEKGTPNETSY